MPCVATLAAPSSDITACRGHNGASSAHVKLSTKHGAKRRDWRPRGTQERILIAAQQKLNLLADEACRRPR
jgi:hypothetical protein